MSEQNDPPINPYAAPESPLDAAPVSLDANLAEIEATRRKYLNHEASVKSVGSLHILGGIFLTAMVIFRLADSNARGLTGIPEVIILILLLGVNFALGFGLTKLQSWARWVDAAFFCIGILMNIASFSIVLFVAPGALSGPIVGNLIGTLFGFLIYGYVLYLLLSPKGAMVFSAEYKEIIKATPHIKYKTSCLLKGLLLLLLAVFLFAILGFALRPR